jgi:hypothetical protein
MLRKKNKPPVAVQRTILSDQLSLLDVIVETCQDEGFHTVVAKSAEQTFTVMIDRGGPVNVGGGGLTGGEALVKAASLREGTYSVVAGWPVDQPVYQLGLAATFQDLVLGRSPQAVQLPPAKDVPAIPDADSRKPPATSTGDGREADPLATAAIHGPDPVHAPNPLLEPGPVYGPDPVPFVKPAGNEDEPQPFVRPAGPWMVVERRRVGRRRSDRRGQPSYRPSPAAITPSIEAAQSIGTPADESEPVPAPAMDRATAESVAAPLEAADASIGPADAPVVPTQAPLAANEPRPAALREFREIAVKSDVEGTPKAAPRAKTRPTVTASVIAPPPVAKRSAALKRGTPVESPPRPKAPAPVPVSAEPKKPTAGVPHAAPPKPKPAAAGAPTGGAKPKKGPRHTGPRAADGNVEVARRLGAVRGTTDLKDLATYLREVAGTAKVDPGGGATAAPKRGGMKRGFVQLLHWTVGVEAEPRHYRPAQGLILVGRSVGSAVSRLAAPVTGAVRGRERRDRPVVASSFGNLGERIEVWTGLVPGMKAWALACAIAAAGVWTLSLRGVNTRGMSDIGLISVLPPGIYAAAALTIIGLACSLRARRGSTALMVFQVAVLIFMLYGATALVEEQPRFSVVYRHAGFAEYIVRNKGVDPGLDAYFNWPGFFIALATVVQALHLRDALALAPWAPVFFTLLYLPPLYLLFESFTRSQRTRWLAIWFFYLGNWVGQDYLSPQALDYFFYLVIIALLLRLPMSQTGQQSISRAGAALKLLAERISRTTFVTAPATEPEAGSRRWIVLLAVVIVFAAIVCSHPLTPFFVIATTVLLVIFGVVGPRWLPALMIVMTAAWMLLMAHAYLAGHLGDVIGSAGSLGPTATSNVTGRLRGSSGHQLVVYARVIMTGLLWGLASLGLVRAVKARQWPLPAVLMAVAPLSLILLQAYGGEMLLRAYLFSLPAVAYLAAVAVVRMRGMPHSNRGSLAIALLSLLMLCGFLLIRYGNERGDYITSGELSTVQRLYSIAPRGSVLATIGQPPWKYRDFEMYAYRALAPEDVEHMSIGSVAAKLRAPGRFSW